jgi:hypothetical protein
VIPPLKPPHRRRFGGGSGGGSLDNAGSSRLLAGGVVEVATWILHAVVSSSVDGVIWSSVVDLPASCARGFLGAVECVNPSPVVAASGVRRSRRWWWCEARQRWQSRVEVLRNRRLPVRKGALPVKGLCGGVAVAAHHRSVLFFVNAVNAVASHNLPILNVKKK